MQCTDCSSQDLLWAMLGMAYMFGITGNVIFFWLIQHHRSARDHSEENEEAPGPRH